MTSTNDKTPPLERYFRILEVLAGFSDGVTLSELASMLALPKATTHRLLATMQKSRLVEQSGGASYTLADRARRLAHLLVGADLIETLTAAHLEQMVAETGETCYIARLDGAQVRTVVMNSPNAPWRGFVLPGKIMHPHATASAKAILAFQPEALITQALSGDLPSLTRHTKTRRRDIKAELARVREEGFATCIGEVDEGLAATAVPIEDAVLGVIYALGVVGPLPRIVSLIDKGLVDRLKAVAAAISALLARSGTEIRRSGELK
ncbi:MAG: IclR family transcriptional regulator [Burkholderiaceae bacterium]